MNILNLSLLILLILPFQDKLKPVEVICDKLIVTSIDGQILILESDAKETVLSYLTTKPFSDLDWFSFEIYIIPRMRDDSLFRFGSYYENYPILKNGGYLLSVVFEKDKLETVKYDNYGNYHSKFDTIFVFIVDATCTVVANKDELRKYFNSSFKMLNKGN